MQKTYQAKKGEVEQQWFLVNAEGKIHMNAAMLVVFLCSLAGFTVLFFWMMAVRVRAE